MKRSEALAELSRDHHVALRHAQRLRRATAPDLDATVASFLAFLLDDGLRHFGLEEAILLPALPPGAGALGERMTDEHARIIAQARALAASPAVAPAQALGRLLADHVRFEERELFAVLEQLPAAELDHLARQLADAEASHAPRLVRSAGSLGDRE